MVRAEPISVDGYRLRIQESLADLEEQRETIESPEISWLQERFPPDLMVRDMGGELFPVDRTDLLRWSQDAEDSSQGRDRLTAYLNALSQQLSWGNGEMYPERPGWNESRKLLDEIYRGKEFLHLSKKKKEDQAWKEYVQRLLQAVGKWLEDHFGIRGSIQARWLHYLVSGVVLTLGAVLIIWIIRLFGPVGWRWKRLGVSPPPSPQSSPEKHWRTWREEAYKKARQGAFREAIRSLFISVLMEGDLKGWWVYEPEATNREHLARVRDHAERHKALQKLMERYERAWYGLRHPGEKEFQDCERWVHRMGASA